MRARAFDDLGFRAVLTIAALTAVTATVGCGGEPLPELVGQDEAAIVNGQTTNGEPATVYIDVGCSGTLVTAKTVLTACHCLENVGGSVGVFFGSSINGSGTWINSTAHQVFPGSCIGNGDLAMIALSEAGPATPIPINDRDLGAYVGQPVRVVGFGVTGENSGGSGVKRVGDSVLGDVENGVMFCNPQIESGTCYGDSGGPNFMTLDGKEYVVGATSYGTQACGSGWDVSARTDTHYTWLMDFIEQHDPGDCGADGQCASNCPAPDPDCPCAADGYCTADCPNLATDPDCAGCEVDGQCRADCPVLDTDCCAADGDCFEACGAADPDCGGGAGPTGSGSSSSSSTGSSGSGSTGSGNPDPQGGPNAGAGGDDAVDDTLYGSVACTASSHPSRGSDRRGALALFALAAAALVRHNRKDATAHSRRRSSAR